MNGTKKLESTEARAYCTVAGEGYLSQTEQLMVVETQLSHRSEKLLPWFVSGLQAGQDQPLL